MAYDHGAFRVRNLEESVKFYTEKLGFKVVSEYTAEQYSEKGLIMELDGARLELIERTDEEYVPVPPERPYCPHLCFEVQDMEETLAMLKRNGIPVLDGPNLIPDSETWVYFTDPDLNVLEYIVWLDKQH